MNLSLKNAKGRLKIIFQYAAIDGTYPNCRRVFPALIPFII
jgi:hypothetical protein